MEWEQKKHLTRVLKPKKKKKKKNCILHMGIFVLHPSNFPPPSFLLILGRQLFCEPHHHFSLSSSQPNTLQNVFPFYLFIFILPKIHYTKHTLKDYAWRFDPS